MAMLNNRRVHLKRIWPPISWDITPILPPENYGCAVYPCISTLISNRTSTWGDGRADVEESGLL